MRKYAFHIALIAVLSILWILFEVFKPTPVSWEPTLINTDKNPYGTYIVFQQAASLFPDEKMKVSRKPVYEQLGDTTMSSYNYLLISQSVTISDAELKKMQAFASAGNNVFIAANTFNDSFIDSLGIKINTQFTFTTKDDTTYRFCNPVVEKRHFSVPSFAHGYFTVADSTLQITGIIEDLQKKQVMVKIATGEGAIILCSLPLVFSNWFVLQQGMSEIPFKALSYLPANRPMVWDEYQKQGRNEDTSPIRTILSNRALSWAYFVSLFGILLVLVFDTRRRRSMVPVVEPFKNTSLEFVKVVGMLHFEQRDYSDIAHKRTAYFLERVRMHYHLPTLKLDSDFAISLSEKSGYNAIETEKLVNELNHIRYTKHVSDTELIGLNKSIERFIIKTKLKI
jgi:hypothetical protein